MSDSTQLLRPLRMPQRWVLALAAATSGVAHIPVIGPHLHEAPYMGVLFILVVSACVTFAALAVILDTRLLYAAAGGVCAITIVGYAATRLVAFPQVGDDVGNWLEPLGIIATTAEAVGVAAAITALRAVRRLPS